MLIDGGNAADSSLLFSYLKKLNVTSIDYMICSHAHEDHVEQAIDKVGDLVDQKTEGKYAAQVDQAQDFLKDKIGEAEPRQ